ncbi:MotA/TolQ/ExbB proton channel family protein [Flavobacterium pallidum]|uniref:Flagellar motor protein MotA n=1 Tax=Flavobacterium pallidum TaxID=2172098 RepID=A0A2S1SGM8_9FLAO|nr:MotA/TolQ/ExbB proton channel family protein [Flavobacterium pallidum]AWI25529.1 flagellar motor protein MotA [Flavobacterium pallidum]
MATPNVAAKKETGSNGGNLFTGIVIVACIVIGIIIWKFVMGAPGNFENEKEMISSGAEAGHPKPGNYLAMVYKGGKIVPVLMGLLLMVVVFSIERFFVISKAAGKGSLDKFMKNVQANIKNDNIDAAIADCDKQEGSVANAIKAALVKYKEVKKEGFDSEAAADTIQKEIEEATSLEMPMLEKNLTIISTLVSLGTLAGLLGTVTGMITAFGALATSGTPDQAALANGISEALINTATGISTSALAIIMYNFFTSKIDTLTYSIDEAGSTIVGTYRRLRGSLRG